MKPLKKMTEKINKANLKLYRFMVYFTDIKFSSNILSISFLIYKYYRKCQINIVFIFHFFLYYPPNFCFLFIFYLFTKNRIMDDYACIL